MFSGGIEKQHWNGLTYDMTRTFDGKYVPSEWKRDMSNANNYNCTIF